MTNKKKFLSVDEYIKSFPIEVQIILENVRQTIRIVLPEATEKIAYEIPTYLVEGVNLISFAGWKNYISIYPVPAGDKNYQERIAKYKKAKSTLQFPLNKLIPHELISQTAFFLKKEKIKGN